VIKDIEPHDSKERYEGLGVECVSGHATIVDPYTVQVGDRRLTTRNIVIATGGRPLVPKIPGLGGVPYLTSDTVWGLKDLPKRLVVLGGGPIGCELAQSFQRLGSAVTIVEMADHILNREDPQVSDLVHANFCDEGLQVLTKHRALECVSRDGRHLLICQSDEHNKKVELEFDTLLLALGRTANVTGFGAEELGLEVDAKGRFASDVYLRTNFPNIFVCGDVTGDLQFTHVAAHEAWHAAVNALLGPFKRFAADYRFVPMVTFSDPEVARVGLNEKEARERGTAYELTEYGIDDLDRAIADGEARGVVRVLTVPGKDKILGATIVGSHAGELLAEFVTAMKYGLGLNKILATIHAYPTFAEANKYAAGVWKKAHKPEGVLRLLERFHAWRR